MSFWTNFFPFIMRGDVLKKNLESISNSSSAREWEEAYWDQFHAAVIGQLFRGILHNLNGVNQAFSLQTSLLKSMFGKSEILLQKIKSADANQISEYVDELSILLKQRSIIVDQMEQKLVQKNSIMKRVFPLANLYELGSDEEVSVNKIIQYEIDILSSISFFKHEIVKNLSLDEHIPLLKHSFEHVHVIIYVIILNAIEALQEQQAEHSEISINTRSVGDKILIEICNSGETDSVDFSNLCRPFYSTKEGHQGLGLYLASKAIDQLGGGISISSLNGWTTFSIIVPI